MRAIFCVWSALLLCGCGNDDVPAVSTDPQLFKLCNVYNFGLQNHLHTDDSRAALVKLGALSERDWAAINSQSPYVGMREAAVSCAIPGEMVSYTKDGDSHELVFEIGTFHTITVFAQDGVVTRIVEHAGG